jgi:ribose 5-phosphate isomerase A
MEEQPELDLTVDGADEVDESLQLIKGGGGAHLREKIVAAASTRMVVIADDSKRVSKLGNFPLPVEIVPFGWRTTMSKVSDTVRLNGCKGPVTVRGSESDPFVTDNGNYILDCAFGEIDDPEQVATQLSLLPGVVEHGLFIGLTHAAVIASADGVEIIGETP